MYTKQNISIPAITHECMAIKTASIQATNRHYHKYETPYIHIYLYIYIHTQNEETGVTIEGPLCREI